MPYFFENGPRAILARLRADLFHTAWYRMPPRLCRAPLVATFYDWIDEKLPFYKPNAGDFPARQRRLAKACAGIVVISHDVARLTIEQTGFSPERMAVVPPAPSETFRAEPPSAEECSAFRRRVTGGAPYVLHVGTRNHYKNFTSVLHGFLAASRRTDRHLVVVGGEKALTDDEAFRIASAGCLERVHFLRRIADAELRVAYAAADAYVSASYMEGFGIPAVEALACGTLPLLSDTPVNREVAGSFAKFVPAADVDAWSELLSGELRPVAGSRQYALEKYSWEKSAQALLALYRGILA
jgi:glycosyltransferase involved in cell wall biosynthesis